MALPLFQGVNDQNFQLLQTGWSTLLNPLLNSVPEYQQSVVSKPTNFGTSGQWSDGTILAINDLGRWLITAQVTLFINGASFTSADYGLGISTTPGNVDGMNFGDNKLAFFVPTSSANSSGSVSWQQDVKKATQYYLKLNTAYTAGPPQFQCKLYATRFDTF